MTAPATPAAAIIVPHFDDVARLVRGLEALRPQLGPEMELVVVDNGSTQDLGPARAALPGLRVVTEPGRGAALARNRGVAETSAPRLFFIDSDCVAAPDWVATALRVADRADLVGGTVTVFDETEGPRSGAQAFETVFAFKSYIERKGFSGSGNLLTTRRVFEAVGGFRPGLSEDLDWCRRATAAGFTLVHEDSLRVAHPTRADWPALARKWRRVTDESWGLRGRSARGRALWALRALLMPLSALAHAPRVLRHPGLRDGGERARALLTLARLRLARAGWMLGQAGRG